MALHVVVALFTVCKEIVMTVLRAEDMVSTVSTMHMPSLKELFYFVSWEYCWLVYFDFDILPFLSLLVQLSFWTFFG